MELHFFIETYALDIDYTEVVNEVETLVHELERLMIQNKIPFNTIRYVRQLGHRSILIEHGNP